MKGLVVGAAGQVECRLVRQLLERNHDMRKAKSWIGFQPRGDLRTMIKSALLFEAGEHDGYTWDGIIDSP